MVLMKESVLSKKENTTQHWFSYFEIDSKYQKSFMTDQLNIIFADFGIWLLGYRIEFSCLYIFHKYFVAMKYTWICKDVWFWAKVHL